MQQPQGASPSLASRVLQHVTGRRHRVYGVIGVALVLLTAAIWVYGGFARGIDFVTSVPHSADRSPTVHSGADQPDGAKNADANRTTAPAVQKTSAPEGWRHSAQSPAAFFSPGIPSKIWQILLPKKPTSGKFVADPKILENTPSWLAMNQDYA